MLEIAAYDLLCISILFIPEQNSRFTYLCEKRRTAINVMSFEWFWNERFWLPNNLTWKDLTSTESKKYGQTKDLWIVVPLTAILILCRVLVEHVIALNIGKALNVSTTSYKKPSNPKLEKAFLLLPKNPTNSDIVKVSKRTDVTSRSLERWIRQHKKSQRPSDMKKFCETFWRFTFYLSSSLLGIYVVHDENYIHDSSHFFTNHPEDHQLKQEYYVYYIAEMAFYCSLLISQFYDIKRKDFVEMFVHHIATVMLISGSYITNFTEIGAVVMLVHDISDVFLEFAKMSKYAKLETATTVAFILLSVAFIVTRLVILPFFVIRSIIFDGMVILKPFNGFLKILFCSVVLLQVLHLYWFSHLIRTACSFLTGKERRDSRSETESSATEQNGVAITNGNH